MVRSKLGLRGSNFVGKQAEVENDSNSATELVLGGRHLEIGMEENEASVASLRRHCVAFSIGAEMCIRDSS